MRRLKKIFRDLWSTRGRVAFMALALAAGLSSLGAVLTIRTVIGREMTREYRESNPASATIDVGERDLSDALLAALRDRPEVAWAERRTTAEWRWRHPGDREWGRALVFAIDDFADQRLALIEHEQGERIPPTGTILVERSAMLVLGAEIGDRVEVSSPGGEIVELSIAGVVHEPALAPAVTEQAGYFYLTAETMALVTGRAPVMDEIRVLVADDPFDLAAVEAQIARVAAWLAEQGVEIHEIRIPPPGEHPHQRPSEAVLLLFSMFAILIVVLAGVLCASLLSTTMARQVREVAVMKTLGATSAQIRRMYVVMLGAVAVAAIAVSALPTWALGRLGSDAIAGLLNFDIASYAVPWWVIAVHVLAGLTLPVLTAMPAIMGASRATVRQALDDHGAAEPAAGLQRLVRFPGDRVVQAGLRNALRVPRRLALTLCLLAVGGGLFVTAASVADSWEAMTEEVFETRHYDVEIHLATAATPDLVGGLKTPTAAETWGFAPVTLATESGLPLSRTYPDGGHGSFYLVAAPGGTRLVGFDVRAGRWLRPDDGDGVVLNQLAAARIGPDPVGARIDLVVEGRSATWRVVGVVDEVAAPATAYVSTDAFTARTGMPLRTLRLAVGSRGDARATRAAVAAVQRELTGRGAPIAKVVPLQLLYNAMGEHVVVLIRSLLALALMMAIVGVLALSSNISISVVERTREIGVLQAIGARPRQIRKMILVEGWFVTLLSLPLAVLVAVPLSMLVGRLIGDLAFRLPLPLDISWLAVAAWSIGVLVIATLASLMPARTAIRRTVREALGHV